MLDKMRTSMVVYVKRLRNKGASITKSVREVQMKQFLKILDAVLIIVLAVIAGVKLLEWFAGYEVIVFFAILLAYHRLIR